MLHEGLFAVGLTESALTKREDMAMIFVDAHSLSPGDPSEKF